MCPACYFRIEVKGSRIEERDQRIEVKGSRFEETDQRNEVKGSRFEVIIGIQNQKLANPTPNP